MPTSSDGILTAEFDPTRGSVLLTVDGGMWPSPVTFITVTRTPLGQPTVPVRGLEMRRVTGGWYIGSDGEMPHDTDVAYQVTGYDSLGAVVQVGLTNVVTDPRATIAARWASFGGAGTTESMVTGAVDGPILPDGSQVTSYARYTINTVGTGNAQFGYDMGSALIPLVPAGASVAIAIYVRSSVAAASIAVRKDAHLAGVASGGAQAGTASTLPANTWERYEAVITNNADFDQVRITAQFPQGSRAVGQVIEVVCALGCAGVTTVPPHFDGSLPPAVWTGAANASTSFLAVPTTVTAPTTGAEWGVWLKVPGRVDFNQRVKLADVGGVSSSTQGGTYPVIGGNEVSETSGVGAERATLGLRTDTASQDAGLQSLLRQYRDLQITTGQPAEIGEGTGADWWHVESYTRSNPGRAPSDAYAPRVHTIQVVRQPVPAGVGLVSTGATYSDVSAQYATYTALSAAVSTYADLMNPGV